MTRAVTRHRRDHGRQPETRGAGVLARWFGACTSGPFMSRRTLLVTLIALATIALSACTKDAPPSSAPTGAEPATSTAPASSAAPLTRVEDPSLVCMVNDTFMAKPQIPVAVDGRTYYGCCPMCKERLANDPAVRTASDPVTGERVDKATAVIARDADGAVRYFASDATLARYVAPAP